MTSQRCLWLKRVAWGWGGWDNGERNHPAFSISLSHDPIQERKERVTFVPFSLCTGRRDSWESRRGLPGAVCSTAMEQDEDDGEVIEVSVRKGTLPFLRGRRCSRRAVRYGASSEGPLILNEQITACIECFSVEGLRYCQVLIIYINAGIAGLLAVQQSTRKPAVRYKLHTHRLPMCGMTLVCWLQVFFQLFALSQNFSDGYNTLQYCALGRF